MVKFAALTAALLAGSASAFAPANSAFSRNVALNAEKSKSLPFMNRPALVSEFYEPNDYDLESIQSSNSVTSSRVES